MAPVTNSPHSVLSCGLALTDTLLFTLWPVLKPKHLCYASPLCLPFPFFQGLAAGTGEPQGRKPAAMGAGIAGHHGFHHPNLADPGGQVRVAAGGCSDRGENVGSRKHSTLQEVIVEILS